MTEADVRILLGVAVEAAGMIAIAWVYTCHRRPAKASPRGTTAAVPETSEDP